MAENFCIMKILIAADIFPPQPGGPATYCVTIANELTKAGDDVRVVSLNPNSDTLAVICRINAVKYKNKVLRYLNYFSLLYKYSKDVDVIYAMGPVNAGLPALIISKLRNKRLATKIVGDYAWEQGVQRFDVKESMDEFQERSKHKIGVRFLRWIQKLVAYKSTNVIVPSIYLKRIVTGWGLSGHCVQVVFNSSHFEDVGLVDKPENEKWIVSAGRLVPWKGMGILISAMPDVLKKYPNAKLKIFGDGPEMDNLKSKVAELKLEGAVDLLGAVDRKNLLCNINSADVFVLNSGYEGLSHVILESLYVGTPVLTSNIGGNPELIIPGKNGNLFPLNDKETIKKMILEFLGNNNLSWGEQEKEKFFKQFSLDSMIKNTREALQNICKN